MLTRRLLGLALLCSLSACGFRPLLKPDLGDPDVRTELAAIEIGGLPGRLGQILRNQLQDDLNPTAVELPPRYHLDVRLRSATDALAIQLDNTITRFNQALTASFQLTDRASRNVLYRSSVTRIASYNQRRAPFAVLVAQEDARRRAAKEISSNIRTLLAAYLQRRGDLPPPEPLELAPAEPAAPALPLPPPVRPATP